MVVNFLMDLSVPSGHTATVGGPEGHHPPFDQFERAGHTKALGWEKLKRFRREMGVDSLEQGDGAHLVEWEC